MTPWFLLNTGDALSFVNSLPASSVDLIVTDPAYESLEKHRAIGTTTRLKKEWFPVLKNEAFFDLFTGLHRVLRTNAHCYVMCDQETAFTVAVRAGIQAGFTFWKALIWNKVHIGMGYHYRATHEFVLFFEKGARQLNNTAHSDVLNFPRVRGGYPTEKPEPLCRLLIENSSAPGEVVLDPFMGSASTGAAAVAAGRHFIGNDVLPKCRYPAEVRLNTAGGYLVKERPREELTLLLSSARVKLTV